MDIQYEDMYGYKHTVTKELSRGGQGVVYRTSNRNIALKLETDFFTGEIKESTDDNDLFNKIRLLPIPKGINLTLPIAPLKNYSGYTMTLLSDMESFSSAFDKEFDEAMPLNEWLKNMLVSSEECAQNMAAYIATGGVRKRLTAYLKAACILANLHMNGLVYCDFSPNNVFVSSDKEFSNVWMIDADNLNYQHITVNQGLYTPFYGAPEVMTGRNLTMYSDVYSFAVSLFWQVTKTHPYKGELYLNPDEDEYADELDEKLMNGEFPWILDENDNSNFIHTVIPFELVFNKNLYSLFNRTFSEEGKQNRTSRPTIYEWCSALSENLDETVECSFCNMNYNRSEHKSCPWCGKNEKMLLLTSEKGKFYAELKNNGSVNVPTRLNEGFSVSHIDEALFEIVIKDGRIFATGFNTGYKFENSTNSTFKFMAGRVELENNSKIRCTEEKTGKTTILEVTVS